MPNRTIAPAIRHAVDYTFHLPSIEKTEMKNGAPLYWYSGGTQEVMELSLVLDAGIWQEPQHGVAAATAALLRNGTTTKSAQEINEALEFYGASFKVSVQNDYAVAMLHCLTKHFPKLLPILKEIFTEAIFPENEIDIYKKNGLQRLQVQLMQCDFVANQVVDAALFGEAHPYGRFTTPAFYQNITQQALQDFYKNTYQQGKVKAFLTGFITDKEVQMVASLFDRPIKTSGQQEHVAPPIQPTKKKKQELLNDPNGVQAAIRIARPFVKRDHPDFTPMVLLNTLYGGYFGSRLMGNIREEKGYTYGIYSAIAPAKHACTLVIQSEVGREVAQAAIDEVFLEMKKLQEEKVSEEELLLVKNYLLGNLLGDLDGPFEIMARWRSLIINEKDAGYFNKNVEIYKSTTPAQLQELAQRYLNPEDFLEITVI